MRYKYVICVAAILLVVFIVVALNGVSRAVRHKSWLSVAPSKLESMAFVISQYEIEEGKYPDSLMDLCENTNFSERGWVKDVLGKTNSFCYNYKYQSNGFVLIVFSPPGHLEVDEKIVKQFMKIELDTPTNSTNSTQKRVGS